LNSGTLHLVLSAPSIKFPIAMASAAFPPASTVDSEEGLFDASTAPTTPDGSLTFSPVLQALRLQDALEEASARKPSQRKHSGGLDATLYEASGVRSICCVGAGYVGWFFPFSSAFLFLFFILSLSCSSIFLLLGPCCSCPTKLTRSIYSYMRNLIHHISYPWLAGVVRK
jgi:hypothetical protein